jgi:hypothetical protein
MKRFIVTFGCLAVLVLAAFSSGREPQPENVRTLMRMKLSHAQSLMEGLAVEDFDKMAKSSADLAVTSQAAAWQVFQTPEYTRQSAEFRKTCDELTKHAKAKDLDAVTEDYLKLSKQCVECHKYVRGVRVTLNDPTTIRRLARE